MSERDRALLTWLAAVKIASENQLIRHFWSQTIPSAARRRLRQLTEKYRLVRPVRLQAEAVAARGLEPGPVYELTPLGRDWLKKTTGGEPGYESKPRQYLHDLLVAEISVRLAETAHKRGRDWTSSWFGEADIRPFAPKGLLPDGMGLLRRSDGSTEFAFFVELDASRESHGRPSSQIGRKVGDYDRYAETWVRRPGPAPLAHFPVVLFITHGAERLANLAVDIRKHRRRQPVAYGLALLDDLLALPELLNSPVWQLLPASDREPDRLNQSLLGDTGWLTPPATPRSRVVKKAAAPAAPPNPKPIATPAPAVAPKIQPASPSSRPVAARPEAQPASAVRPAAVTSSRPPAPPQPVLVAAPLAPERRRPAGLSSQRLIWLWLLILAAMMVTSSPAPLLEVRDWLNATPTPTPTATPHPFAHVPTATPYGRNMPSSQPGFVPFPAIGTPWNPD